MFDTDEFIEEVIITIGIGLLGYERIINPKLNNYEHFTKEDAIHAYHNNPVFNRAVDTIASHLLKIFERKEKESNASTKI